MERRRLQYKINTSASREPMMALMVNTGRVAFIVTAAAVANTDIFVPQVRGPNDPIDSAASAQQAVATPAPAVPDTDHADTRHGGSDAAFVF